MLDLNNYVATSVSWPQDTRKASTVKSFADVAWLCSCVEPQKEREN